MNIIISILYKILDKIWYFDQFDDWNNLRCDMSKLLKEIQNPHLTLNWEMLDAVQYDILHGLKMPIYDYMSGDSIKKVDIFIRKNKLHRKKIEANRLIELLHNVKFY